MNQLEFARIRESLPHGDIRFHMRLHEMTAKDSWQESVPSHWHEEYELLVITGGSGTAHMNSRSIAVKSGDSLFINAGMVHSLFSEGGGQLAFYALDFGRELISSYGNDDIQQKYINRQSSGELVFRDHFVPGETLWQELHGPLEEIRSLCREQSGCGNELLIKADLLRIWHFLCRDSAQAGRVPDRKDDEKIVLIKEVLQYIQENYSQNLTLGTLACRFHMSEGQFCRFFKSQINMTAIEYVNFYRIGMACDLLTGSAAPVSSVAIGCGYNNISYFNRMFRKYMHCTPGEYREKNR